MRAALIIDDSKIKTWQRLALEEACNIDVVLVLNCQNTERKRDYAQHFLYYALNLVALKSYLTRSERFSRSDIPQFNFHSDYEGAWQALPSHVYEIISEHKVDLIVKFGMGLLKIDYGNISTPTISYHHGDPAKYRGRPAGFYEILNREKTQGVIVQKLSNQLDRGEILAFGESKIVNFSYKKTSVNSYKASPALLNIAARNLESNRFFERSTAGKNYRLPSNLLVLKFTYTLLANLIRKITYGLFFENKWKVAIAPNKLSLTGDETIQPDDLQNLPIYKSYGFYADPFFSTDDKSIRVEALDKKTGLGDILEIGGGNYSSQRQLLTGQHFSYPFSFIYGGKEYLLPEVASHSAQYICLAKNPNDQHILRGLEEKRIVDATLFCHNEVWFLFFGDNNTAHSILQLWQADSPFGVFTRHPASPITISPSSARMGGDIIRLSNKILRLGQNNSGEYGESLSVMEISILTSSAYEEKKIGSLTIDKFKGPHSLSFNANMSKLLIDYYDDRFSVFAGVRRVKARLHRT